MHVHDDAQLTFVVSGVVQVQTSEGRWFVPPQLAVWIPPNVMHTIEVLTDAELWLVHWQPTAISDWAPRSLPDRTFALHVTSLLGSLLNTAFADDTSAEKAELVVRLMLHELVEAPDAPTFLPLPSSPVGRRIAKVALGDPQNRLSAAETAFRAATSVRSMSRLFPTETGLTFKAWRQRARIMQAMERLAHDQPIAQVSSAAGFASTAAFSCAFRQVTGTTPSAFLGRPR
ncbi:helix-turn-helix transcriptional regulator [Aureimonas sp. ME7]|uniref:AraC family transcriptional regulator n=1 Tax=Aureimonas sp. ME7 TaxID=2744252 RepID=UPI001FCE5864|nr:helix-turn-helix transcriptional regulator [Aureimonas sp. ME7]